MAFSGWGDEAFEFYEGLEADNTKTYWTKQRAVYDRCVLGPMTELLGELGQSIAKIEKQDIEVHGRDVLKTVPRGYPADHPRGELLRYKGIVAWKEWPPEPWLETAEAKDRIAGFLRAARPLSEWLDTN